MFVNSPENRAHFFVLELGQQENQEKTEVLDRFEKQVAQRAIKIIETIKKSGFGSIVES